MTTRLYYTDALLTTFEATVVTSTPVDGHTYVVLDKTAFYPTSGGQPFDTGSLGGRKVLDVVDHDDAGIAHVVDGPIEPGTTVTGVIDWARRFDHLQQHSGQHILSAAFERECGARTESFHLGVETCTIDLAREVSAAEIAAAETLACSIVFENRPVRVRFASETEAAALPLRKDPTRTGTLRLVEIEDCDLSACGGTHVPATGRVGAIVVTGWEKRKHGTRIAFACGHRAVASHRRLSQIVTALVKQLTVAPHEIGAAIERFQAEGRANQKALRQLRETVAANEAGSLAAAAEDIGVFRRVIATREGWDLAALKTLATAIVAHRGCVAVVIGDDTPVPVVAARSEDVTFDAGAWIKQITSALGGRGGGRPELAQGGVAAPLEKVVAFAQESVR